MLFLLAYNPAQIQVLYHAYVLQMEVIIFIVEYETGVFPAQRPVTRGLDVFFDLRLNKRLNKQSWG